MNYKIKRKVKNYLISGACVLSGIIIINSCQNISKNLQKFYYSTKITKEEQIKTEKNKKMIAELERKIECYLKEEMNNKKIISHYKN